MQRECLVTVYNVYDILGKKWLTNDESGAMVSYISNEPIKMNGGK